MKVTITGSTGLVGSRIVELLKDDFEFVPLLQQDIDITDKPAVQSFLNVQDFDMLLHLAAYTNVDKAESEQELARNVNVVGTQNLFDVVTSLGKKFVYISTDFVFDGQTPPYFEDSLPNPINYYGQTKYEGEQVVEDTAMIVRISYPYRATFSAKNDFMNTLKNLLSQGKQITMVEDSLFTPTFIDDIAYGLKFLFNNFSSDVYHLVGATSLSPYEAAVQIAKAFNLDQSLIKKTTYEEYFKDKAKRPRYMEIKSKKNNFPKMKSFEKGLTEIKKQLL